MYEIVKCLQGPPGHLCGMTGDDATTSNDAPALSRANVGIAVEGATDAALGGADILLTESSLSPVVHTIRGSRIIFNNVVCRCRQDRLFIVRGVPISRTTSRAASVHESLYSNCVSITRCAARKVDFGGRVLIKPEELQHFSSYQAQNTGPWPEHPFRTVGVAEGGDRVELTPDGMYSWIYRCWRLFSPSSSIHSDSLSYIRVNLQICLSRDLPFASGLSYHSLVLRDTPHHTTSPYPCTHQCSFASFDTNHHLRKTVYNNRKPPSL
ncbi:hypothetical protein K435DRAFT_850644 [Dendrothele bispora CBS 962.96]|uniref:Uncharacterized protein n=1 Tax=Dendrothele bispora (strain CBS 962.96) TaxID=1314807 RepID=A0A4S8MP98_DENBC|nr:hypothetical protein K435DRAFT_850644 [Dendrothele bispora CBS 962.96]